MNASCKKEENQLVPSSSSYAHTQFIRQLKRGRRRRKKSKNENISVEEEEEEGAGSDKLSEKRRRKRNFCLRN